MIAIDTNVVVRLIALDDPAQTQRARELVATERVFVTDTVILEAAWVLFDAYDFDQGEVVEALWAFAGLPQVVLDSPERVSKALTWASDGLEFADALHLAAAAEGCSAFASFDRRLNRRGPPLSGIRALEP